MKNDQESGTYGEALVLELVLNLKRRMMEVFKGRAGGRKSHRGCGELRFGLRKQVTWGRVSPVELEVAGVQIVASLFSLPLGASIMLNHEDLI